MFLRYIYAVLALLSISIFEFYPTRMNFFSRGYVDVHVLVFEDFVPIPPLSGVFVTVSVCIFPELVTVSPDSLFYPVGVHMSRRNRDNQNAVVEAHTPASSLFHYASAFPSF